MNAITQTYAAAASALRLMVKQSTAYHGGATFARIPRTKLVIDLDAKQVVGTVCQWPSSVEWMSGSRGGYVDTMDEALAAIERETLVRRNRHA